MMLALSCSVAPRCEDEGAAEVGVVNVSSEDCSMEKLFLHWVQLSDGDFADIFEETLGAINAICMLCNRFSEQTHHGRRLGKICPHCDRFSARRRLVGSTMSHMMSFGWTQNENKIVGRFVV